MFRNCCGKFCIDDDRSHPGPNVSITAQSGSNITAPVLANNTIQGNVTMNITNNAHGNQTCSEKTQTSDIQSVILKHKKLICSEYQYVTEYNSLPGEHVLLSERFTQPLIIQTHRGQKEREEQIRSGGENSRSSQDSVHLNSLFNPDGHGISPSVVILQGNTGNGKSFTVQKIMLDWASDNLYKEHFDIVFHLQCNEINHIPDRNNLVKILSHSCGLSSDQISQILQHTPEKVLFIIDGFDELRLKQGQTPAEVTLCSLLKGRILPESFLLVTTRSTAVDTLAKLLKRPQRFSEIMGFSEKGAEEYFQKFFQNEELFKKAYQFVKSNKSLFTICSIPVICWIICTVLREKFREGSDLTSGLETTTSIYVDFVCTLLDHHGQGLSQPVLILLRSLGQLAEKGILEQHVLFDEKSGNEAVSDPTGNPFLCKFLFKRRIHQETMFSFMHLSFQEFFTALYYVLLDEQDSQRKLEHICPIKGGAGRLYLRLRHFLGVVQFAFGLLNKKWDSKVLKKHDVVVHPSTEAYLKKWILEMIQYENTFLASFFLQCLYELHEEDFVKKAMDTCQYIRFSGSFHRRTDYWALLYCCQCCQSINGLNVHGYKLATEILTVIQPELHKFRRLRLDLEDPAVSDLVELMRVLMSGRIPSSQDVLIVSMSGTMRNCSVKSLKLSFNGESSSVCISTGWNEDQVGSMEYFILTLPHEELININWTNVFQIIHQKDLNGLLSVLYAFSKLKKMEIKLGLLTEKWSILTLQIIQNCCSLTELEVHANYIQEEGLKILQSSRTRPDCIMSFKGHMCNKPTGKCTRYEECDESCNQLVNFHLSSQGFHMETS